MPRRRMVNDKCNEDGKGGSDTIIWHRGGRRPARNSLVGFDERRLRLRIARPGAAGWVAYLADEAVVKLPRREGAFRIESVLVVVAAAAVAGHGRFMVCIDPVISLSLRPRARTSRALL